MAVLLAISVIMLVLFVVGIYEKNTNAVCKSRKRLDGKTALVTGGTAGMGLEIATDFAQRGARVIIACPYQQEGEEALKHIISTSGNKKVIFKLLDLASLSSVRSLAENVLKTEDRLDILMNNAGVGVPANFMTKDGLNFIMQVNYYGHFLLTLLLLPLLIKSGTRAEPSRIVNTSSVLHRLAESNVLTMNRFEYWFKVQIYCNSKFCVIPFSRELTRRLKGGNVVINNVDPGTVGTRIFDSIDKISGVICTIFFKYVYKTPWEGAQTALYAALDSKAAEISGEHFKNCRLSKAMGRAYNDKIARDLWEESVRLVKLSDDELEHCFKSL